MQCLCAISCCRNHHSPSIGHFDTWVIKMMDINAHRKILSDLIDRYIKSSVAFFLFLYLALPSDEDELRQFKKCNATWCNAHMQMWIKFQNRCFRCSHLIKSSINMTESAHADTYINTSKHILFINAKIVLQNKAYQLRHVCMNGLWYVNILQYATCMRNAFQ